MRVFLFLSQHARAGTGRALFRRRAASQSETGRQRDLSRTQPRRPFLPAPPGPVGTTKLFETLSRKFWKPTASTGRSRSGSHGKPQDSDGPEFKGRAERGYPEASSSGVSVQLKIFFELLSNSSQRIITLCLTRFPIFVKSLLLAPARRLGATPLSRDVTKYVCDRSRPPFNSGRVAPRTSLRRSSYAGVIRLAL